MSKGGGSSPVATLGPMQPFAPGAPSQPIPTAGFTGAPQAADPNIYTQSAQNMAQATQNVGMGTGLMASGALPISMGMGMYQNPFENQVMGAFQDDLARQTAIQQSANQARAAGSGAFGGSRHGLVEAQTNEAAQRNLGQFSAGLRSQGFNTAAQLSNQDIQNRLAAGTGLFAGAGLSSGIAGQQFGMGQDIADQQWRQGMLQQGMNQMLLDDARGMFNQYVNQPQNLLDLRSSAASLSPLNQAQSQSSSYEPGLFDYLSLAAQTVGGGMGQGGAFAPGGRFGGR
jgi:hypothetical protein